MITDRTDPCFLWAEKAWEKLEPKLQAECKRTGSNLPFIPIQGHYRDCMMPNGLWWWTNGFWPGILWQAYHATSDEQYRDAASGACRRLAETLSQPEKLEHDVGFMFQHSAVARFRLTGDTEARETALQAAKLLLNRMNEPGSFLRAWNESHWMEDSSGLMIIDCMMNLSLLFWASEETGDPCYKNAAVCHAKTSLRYLLRSDGSCAHIASFDPQTGEFLGTLGGQGYGEGSSWSRGQGWAVYGFALAYRHTRQLEFLDAAKRSAHYCIASLSHTDWVPLRDFRAPAEPLKFDSGAGAVIACGLLELAEHLPKLERPLYQDAAVRLLRVCEEKFANYDPNTDGVLDGGATMYHDERLANAAIIYNDYFYTEAVLRLIGKSFVIW